MPGSGHAAEPVAAGRVGCGCTADR